MLYDRQAIVRTEKGIILFRLTSHTVSYRKEGGRGALHVQISIPEESAPQTATVFQAYSGEFHICPSDQKVFRFKKDRYGLYNYLDEEKMHPLEVRSRGHISLLVINYLEIVQTFQTLH